MLRAKDYRNMAWKSLGGSWLGGNWAIFAVITLFESLILAFGGGLSWALIGLAILIIVSGPLSLSNAVISLNVAVGAGVKLEDIFSGFKNMGTVIILWLLNELFIFLWTLLFIIPGIVKRYSYSMSYFILRDNPTISQEEARYRSIQIMRGNKWRLFCLDFSFIGWEILSLLTFGIISFWVTPYRQTAYAHFYISVISGNQNV